MEVIVSPSVATVVVTSDDGQTTIVEAVKNTLTTVIAQGPQGPQGAQGPPGPSSLVVDGSAKVDKSIVYYDLASNTFKADSNWTTSTIVDGANF